MSSYKEPSFQERTALASRAKKAALERLREKPLADEATLADRREAAQARETAQRKASDEKLAARGIEKEKRRKLAEQKANDIEAADPSATDAEKKVARDAKYAARKSRTGKKQR